MSNGCAGMFSMLGFVASCVSTFIEGRLTTAISASLDTTRICLVAVVGVEPTFPSYEDGVIPIH